MSDGNAQAMEDRRILEATETDLAAEIEMIAEEFRLGFEAVDAIDKPAVTVFGSARVDEDDELYASARECGRLLAEAGFAVVTGGGPGVMEAANRGARDGGGQSVGFNIELPHEQEPNAFLDLSVTFRHFYARKVCLVKAAEGFILFPGGFGTLDEMFEALTLIQTDKVFEFPVVLIGREHWAGLLDWLHGRVLPQGMISPEDEELLFVVDDIGEAVQTIHECWVRHCAQTPAQPEKADAQ